jgi:hypothetical protein
VSSPRRASALHQSVSGGRSQQGAGVDVVAVTLSWRGHTGMFRRSQSVAHERGLWHCLTGYLLEQPNDCEPARRQAQMELEEEAGLAGDDLEVRVARPILEVHGVRRFWRVQAFHVVASLRRLTLYWCAHVEHLGAPLSTILRLDGRVALARGRDRSSCRRAMNPADGLALGVRRGPSTLVWPTASAEAATLTDTRVGIRRLAPVMDSRRVGVEADVPFRGARACRARKRRSDPAAPPLAEAASLVSGAAGSSPAGAVGRFPWASRGVSVCPGRSGLRLGRGGRAGRTPRGPNG